MRMVNFVKFCFILFRLLLLVSSAAAAGIRPGHGGLPHGVGMPPFPFPPDAAAAYTNGMNGLLHGNLSPGGAVNGAAGFRPNQLDALRMAQQFGPQAIAAMGLAHPALAAAAQGQHQTHFFDRKKSITKV